MLPALVAPALTSATLPLAARVLRGWRWPSMITSSRRADAAVHDPDAPRAVTSASTPDPVPIHG